MTPPVDDFPCNEFVELVTDYLEGAMAPAEVRRLEEHLTLCAGCESVLKQFQTVIRLSGRLSTADVDALPPSEREPVMEAFRVWAAARERG
jgi:predicted anti-sigma-YlaC factor YlaD